MKNMLKREDVVVVISGDARGKTGKVLNVLKGKGRVIVEGIAVAKKHVKKSQEYPTGAILEKNLSIHKSNVMLKTKMDAKLLRRNKNA